MVYAVYIASDIKYTAMGNENSTCMGLYNYDGQIL